MWSKSEVNPAIFIYDKEKQVHTFYKNGIFFLRNKEEFVVFDEMNRYLGETSGKIGSYKSDGLFYDIAVFCSENKVNW